MYAWLVAFAVTGLPLLPSDGAVIAPLDIHRGHQVVPLRSSLVARTAGARLVLFVRELKQLTGPTNERNSAFEQAVPLGSVRALLSNANGTKLELEHTSYTYYRGFAGLVLTEIAPGERQTRYQHIELDADLALPRVRFVWLDQPSKTVRDVPPPR